MNQRRTPFKLDAVQSGAYAIRSRSAAAAAARAMAQHCVPLPAPLPRLLFKNNMSHTAQPPPHVSQY
jgi:hypothetical protein